MIRGCFGGSKDFVETGDELVVTSVAGYSIEEIGRWLIEGVKDREDPKSIEETCPLNNIFEEEFEEIDVVADSDWVSKHFLDKTDFVGGWEFIDVMVVVGE